MFEDLDFSKLKLPIEPKNLIYIYLAYKLINNLDKLHLPKKPTPSINNNFIFLVILLIGCSFLFLNNILNRISFSSISVENLSTQEPQPGFGNLECKLRCPLKNKNNQVEFQKCPIRRCPLFARDSDLTEMLQECLKKCKKSEQANSDSDTMTMNKETQSENNLPEDIDSRSGDSEQ